MKKKTRFVIRRGSVRRWRKIAALLTMFVMLAILAMPAFAVPPTGTGGDLAASSLVTGTKKLLNDASMTGMILAPIIAVGFIIYFFIRKNAADEMDQKKWNSRIWTTLASVVGVELAGIIVSLVMNYYV